MGWVELNAWLKAMRRQREAAQPDPFSWRVHDPWFAEQHERVRQERKRGY